MSSRGHDNAHAEGLPSLFLARCDFLLHFSFFFVYFLTKMS